MPTKTFIYQQTGTSKIFPIDYSGREFSRKTSVNQQKIKTWIMEESPMSKQLKGLVMNNNSEEYERMDNEKGKTPYPVEAMPFLECYVNLIKKDKYSKIFIDPTKTETRKIFLREFCTQICSFLLPDKNEKNAQPTIDCIDQNTFARHTIFGNQTFSREIMDDLWEREFDSRIKTIRERAKNLPYDKQAELLKAYLITMDEWILGLPEPKKRRNNRKPEIELQYIFKGLLIHRKKTHKQKKGFAEYRIKNILFDTKKLGEANNMEKAFDILSQRGDNCSADMLNEIREVYLCELGKMEIPNFEKEYLALQDYLTSFPSNPQKVKTTFVKEMKTWGSAVVDYCMMTDNSQIEQNWLKGNHTESLLNTTAINNINQYWGLIEQTRNYNMMRLANETARNKATTAIQRQIQILQLAIPKNASSETMSITNKVISVLEQAAQSLQNATMIWRTQQKDLNCADIAKSFIEYFEQCCTWLGYNGKLINKKEIVEQHSIIFATKTNEAIDFLGKRSISPFTSCGVQNALERCFNMGSEHKESFDIIFEFLPPLQFGLLLQTLHKIAIDSNEEEMYKTLANLHIKNYQNNFF